MELINSESDLRATPEAKARIQSALDGGCTCGSGAARLTRRTVVGNVTIHLQCVTCGRSIAGALPRKQFFFWQDFASWDEELSDRYWLSEDQQKLSEARQQAVDERRQDYQEWLASSPEWRAIRMRVLQRANYRCEACLVAPAQHVHHETYAFGRCPPAWELRAICADCHSRLHRGWAAEGEVAETLRLRRAAE